MLLYEHPLSSYAQKVKIALREKGLPFEAQLPDSSGTGQKEGPFVVANPPAEVPVLMRERTGGQSSITAFRSVYYMVKVLLAIFVGMFRRYAVPEEVHHR